MLIWTDKFSTGSDQLDQQHQTLIDNINELEMMLMISFPTRAEYEQMLKVIDFLEFYSREHFTFEEQCMEAYRCPMHHKNKLAHGEFIGFFKKFKDHYRIHGFSSEEMTKLHEVVAKWITDHILGVDTHLKACIKG